MCTPWPISVQQWRTSTSPSSENRTTALMISTKPFPSPEFLSPKPRPDRLAVGDRLLVGGLDGLEASAGPE